MSTLTIHTVNRTELNSLARFESLADPVVVLIEGVTHIYGTGKCVDNVLYIENTLETSQPPRSILCMSREDAVAQTLRFNNVIDVTDLYEFYQVIHRAGAPRKVMLSSEHAQLGDLHQTSFSFSSIFRYWTFHKSMVHGT